MLKGNTNRYISLDLSGSTVTSIGNQAFQGCAGLTSITIPNGVTSIGENAFYLCASLASVTIPNSVTSIQGNTFRNCTSLASITIPNSVTSIGGSAFYQCTSLTSVIFLRNGLTNIEYASVFPGDLVTKSGGTGYKNRFGKYTTANPGNNATWTK